MSIPPAKIHVVASLAVLAAHAAPVVAATRVDAGKFAKVDASISAGRFAEAEQMIGEQLADPHAPATDPWAIRLEIIRRIRMDYSLSAEQMLENLRRRIPDATGADVERWRAQGMLQHRTIDGEIRFFRREPSNLLRFCKEARQKRHLPVEPAGYEFDLTRHVAKLVKVAESSSDPLIHPVRHHVTYTLRVNEHHPRVKDGAKVRCWLPFPQEYRQQTDVRLISTTPPGAEIAANGQPHRTVYFEHTVKDASKPPEFRAEFAFTTYAVCPTLDPEQAQPADKTADWFRTFTAERPPHIVFSPMVKRIVREVADNEPNPLVRARKIFRWVNDSIHYCSEMEYSTIPSISAKALESRRGDCGVQGLLFITLCRAAGIPARWQSGWESLPNRWNMHDWAEFHVEPWGWSPADPSYGIRTHHDPRVAEFYCGSMDAYRMIVNLDYGRPSTPPKTSFRSEPNDFQRGEIEIDGHNLYFDEWDWTLELQTLPPDGELASVVEALDAVVPDLLRGGDIPGAVIEVGRRTPDGYETWQKAYGLAQTKPAPHP